jgi:beta-galactosidase
MSENVKLSWPISGFARGADWNPDQWPKEVWLRDLQLMKEAKVNLVSFPVFGWSQLETSEGIFDFDLLDDLLNELDIAGIGADLATATATPPAWLVRKHPDVLPVAIDGLQFEYGSRQSYCPNSESFRSAVVRLVSTLAKRYRDHPALKMWHISNEYGDHISRCYCKNCETKFRKWLEAKYTRVSDLNDAWGTKVWGQTYSSFEDINSPRKTMAPGNPSHLLDYARFATDSITELLVMEKKLLEELSPNKPVLTNFMTLLTDVDYWKLSEHVDYVAFDNYPDPADSFAHNSAALNYSVMRSLANKEPWMLLESATSAVSWRRHNVPKPDGLNRLHAFQAVAHGSEAVMYFQWRASLVGAERFHSAVVGHYGEQSRTFAETKKIWRELDSLKIIVGSKVRASAAFLVDWESRWAMSGPETMPSDRLIWIEQMRDYNRALLALGVSVDAVHPESELSDYDLIIAPSSFMLSSRAIENLTRYVSSGGHLVFGPFSGVVDENNHVPESGFLGNLSKIFGIQIEEYWPIEFPVEVNLSSGGKSMAKDWTELIHIEESVDILGRYGTGPLADRPAVTAHGHGKGTASYVSCNLDFYGLLEILRVMLAASGIAHRSTANEFVESVVRTNGLFDFCFILNHGMKPAQIRLPEDAEVLLSDSEVVLKGFMGLSPGGVLIFQVPSRSSSNKQSASLRLTEVIEVQ